MGTGAQHRFTRQEFSEHLADAPAAGSEIGKTGWEVPYLAPGEEAWREHRATLEAPLLFRDFELARPTPDGGKRLRAVAHETSAAMDRRVDRYRTLVALVTRLDHRGRIERCCRMPSP